MNEKQKNRKLRLGGKERYSALDIVIVFLLLVAVAGIGFRWVSGALDTEAVAEIGENYFVSFKISETSRYVLEDLRGSVPETDAGADASPLRYEAVYAADGGYFLGDLSMNTLKINVLPAGTTLPDRAVGTGKLLCKGVMENDSLRVQGSDRYLSVGSELAVRTERVVLTIKITQIVSAAD